MKRRFFSGFLALVIVILMLPPMNLTVRADSGASNTAPLTDDTVTLTSSATAWDGSYDISWYSSCTADTYHISTAKELAGIAYLVNTRKTEFLNKTIYIDEDINLSGAEWIPIDWGGWTDYNRFYPGFRGILDGQNHTISNMTITSAKAGNNAGLNIANNDYYTEIGLFGRMDGITRNLTIDQAVINLPDADARKVNKAGIITGSLCFDEPKSNNILLGEGLGGIYDCKVTNSTIQGVGIGVADPIAAYVYYGAVTSNCTETNDTVNITRNPSWVNNYDEYLFRNHASMSTIDIYTPYQLAAIIALSRGGEQFQDKTIKLKNDIDMSMYEWMPIKDFRGNFDGGYNSITGIHNAYRYDDMAFIEISRGCTVSKLTLSVDFSSNENIEHGNSVAGIVAKAYGGLIYILDCSVYGTVGNVQNENNCNTCPSYSGGFVGSVSQANVTLQNCNNYASVGGCSAGGFVANTNAYNYTVTLNSCMNAGSVYSTIYGCSGGLVGRVIATEIGIHGCGVLQNTASGAQLRISSPNYASGFIGEIDDGTTSPTYYSHIVVNDSFCTAEIVCGTSGYGAGMFIMNSPSDNRQTTFDFKACYFGGRLAFPDGSINVNHHFLTHYFNKDNTSASQYSFAQMSHIYCLNYMDYYENGSRIKVNYRGLTVNNTTCASENAFSMTGTSSNQYSTNIDVLGKLNSNKANDSVQWYSLNGEDGRVFQYGLPFLLGPVNMHSLTGNNVGSAGLMVSAVENSDLRYESYENFWSKYSSYTPYPEVSSITGMTFVVDSMNSNSDEALVYSLQLFHSGDKITLYQVNDARNAYKKSYTYTITGNELHDTVYGYLPLVRFKNGSTAFPAGYSGSRTLYFVVEFGKTTKELSTDIGVCGLRYNSGRIKNSATGEYYTSYKVVVVKQNSAFLYVSNTKPVGGSIVIDPKYLKANTDEAGMSTYCERADRGIDIDITPEQGYKVKSVTFKDKDNPALTKSIPVGTGDSVKTQMKADAGDWNLGKKCFLEAEFEKNQYSVQFKGEHTTLCNKEGTSVDTSTARVEFGDKYEFKVNVESGYNLAYVMVNGQKINADPAGVYTVEDNKDMLRIQSVLKSERAMPLIKNVPTTITYGDNDFNLSAEVGNSGESMGECEWRSDDTSVVSIDTTGKVTIHSAGNASIYVKIKQNADYGDSPEAVVPIHVEKKGVSISNTTVEESKTYDGNVTAKIVNPGTFSDSDICAGDDVRILTGSAAYASESVAVGKQVSFTGFTLTGADAGNYKLLSQPADTTASITQKELTVEVSVSNKQYDGGKNAEFSVAPSLSGVVDGDDVQLTNGVPSFTDASAGENIPINITDFEISGTDAANYSLTQPSGITADIYNTYNAKQGTDYDVNSNDWMYGDFVITAKSGYELSMTNTPEGTWQSSITASDETSNGSISFYVRNTATGAISSSTTEYYRIDKTPPLAAININTKTWNQFLNTVALGIFYKESKLVTITPSDTGSGVKSVEYLISETRFDSESAVTGTWKTLDVSGGVFSITPNSRQYIYVRVKDVVGNQSIINSEGHVLYTDSEQDTKNMTYVKTTDKDVTAHVKLNGNTVREIKNNNAVIQTSNYSVDNDGTITFKSSYLDSLKADSYSLTVSYNPLGENYVNTVGNTAPNTTEIALKVEKADNTVNNITNVGKIYDGKAVSEPGYSQKGTGAVKVEYKPEGSDDNTYSTLVPKSVGKYVVRITAGADENYGEASSTAGFTIEKKELTVNAVISDKQYDGLNKADFKGSPVLIGVIDGDEVKLENGVPSFADISIGNEIAINFSAFAISGADSGNYRLTQPTGVVADIYNTYNAVPGNDYEINNNEWISGTFMVTAKSGHEISKTNTTGGTWQSTLSASDETANGSLQFYVRNSVTGAISTVVTETYKIDKTPPLAAISIDSKTWNKFLGSATFGLFFREAKTVNVTSSDSDSGVKSVEYLLSEKRFDTQNAVKGTWKALSVDGGSFNITPNSRQYIYVRVFDAVGNQTIINSDGCIVYTDSGQNTNDITYIKTSGIDTVAQVVLNGNTVKEIRNNDNVIPPSVYSVNGDGTITIKASYLESLVAGSYKLTVSYNPQGVKYIDGAENISPGTTVITLNVKSAENVVTNPIIVDKTNEGKVVEDKIVQNKINKDKTVNEITKRRQQKQKDSKKPLTNNNAKKTSDNKEYKVASKTHPAISKNVINHFTATKDKEYTINSNDWLNKDFTVTAKDGYQISLTDYQNSIWEDTLNSSDETAEGLFNFYVKNIETGAISYQVSENYKVDKTAPVGEITVGDKVWNKFLSKITFDLCFDEAQTVSITTDEDLSGIAKVEYYLSEKMLTRSEVESLEGWTEGQQMKMDFSNHKQFVYYARITDCAGNITYLSTDGIKCVEESQMTVSQAAKGKNIWLWILLIIISAGVATTIGIVIWNLKKSNHKH